MNHPVYIAGSGTYLPGEPIPFENADTVLGELNEAPQKIQKWIARMKPVMAELLDIKYLHYAIVPKTREFTDDNISMSVKSARIALKHAGCQIRYRTLCPFEKFIRRLFIQY